MLSASCGEDGVSDLTFWDVGIMSMDKLSARNGEAACRTSSASGHA